MIRTHHVRRSLSLWLPFGLAAFVTLHFGQVALADTYPGTFFPTSNPQTACWVPNPNTGTIPGPIWDHLFGYMNTTLHNQTGINVQWTTNCGTSTDMRLDDRLNNPNFFGLTTCANLSGSTCKSWNVSINWHTINPAADAAGFSEYAVQQFNWCHETGHSLGLGHENGCMTTGVAITTVYSSHHVTHIDARF